MGADPFYEVVQLIVADVVEGIFVGGFYAIVEVPRPHQHLGIPHTLPLLDHTPMSLIGFFANFQIYFKNLF